MALPLECISTDSFARKGDRLEIDVRNQLSDPATNTSTSVVSSSLLNRIDAQR